MTFKTSKSRALASNIHSSKKKDQKTLTTTKCAFGHLQPAFEMVATKTHLVFAVSVVNQFTLKLGPMQWVVVKQIMRYLKGTLDMKLGIGGKHINLKGYSNADWVDNVESRRSTSGYVFLVGDMVVLWNSKWQQMVAQSTMEAEYMATSRCTMEATWLRHIMKDVGCI